MLLAVIYAAFITSGVSGSVQQSEVSIDNITAFLTNDTTDNHECLPWYTCGHFARSLARNASEQNITMGSAIVGNHPTLRGHGNHIINYVYVNDELLFIEPQTDTLMYLSDVLFEWEYIRLYPDGTQVPTYRTHGLAPTIRG